MICKTGLTNMVRPNTVMVKGCMVQCWMQRRPLIELTTVNYSEMIKMKNLPLLVPQKKSRFLPTVSRYELCDKYRDTSMNRADISLLCCYTPSYRNNLFR